MPLLPVLRSALLAALALGCGACASGVTVHDVRNSFVREEATMRPTLPEMTNIVAMRTEDEDPMAHTIALAEQYNIETRGHSLNNSLVSALLCCGYLAHGRVAEAHDIAKMLSVPGSNTPEEDRRLIRRVKWLAGACHALAGHQAVNQLEATEKGEVDFLETWGSLAGFPLPRRTARDYLRYLEQHALDLRRVCFPPEPRSPVQLDARTQRFWEMRRTLAEQVYNDTAALLETLHPVKEGTNAEDRFFAMAVSSLYITISYLSEDLIPHVEIAPAQKQWMREQSLSTYDIAREIARHYVSDLRVPALEKGSVPEASSTPAECRDRLYARLFIAQKEVLFWITIQDARGDGGTQ